MSVSYPDTRNEPAQIPLPGTGVCGRASEFYPYWFINVSELGYQRVLLNSAMLVAGFVVLMSVFLIINHRREELRVPDAEVESDDAGIPR